MNKIDTLSDYEIARWGALYWGINLVAEAAESKKLKFDEVRIDQPALSKYVDELSDDILFAMERETYNIED